MAVNQQLSQIFFDIALYLQMNKVAFKPLAYKKAALLLKKMPADVGAVYQEKGVKGLEDIDGIGKGLAEKIEEFLQTGKIKYYEELKKKMPVDNEAPVAAQKEYPNAITLSDIKGDLHCHSDWNGGHDSIADMAQKARDLGYDYLGIADHTKFLQIEHGLDEKQLAQQRKEIDKLNLKFKNQSLKFRVLQGCEANIMADGSIDIVDEALAKLDYAIAGVHSQMKMPKEEMTARIIKAIKNPHIDIISHPTGRLLGERSRDEFQMDFAAILRAAKEYKTILEINASPWRMDLKAENIQKAKMAGVKMIISTDSHQAEQMALMRNGIALAQRGLTQKSDIINTLPLNKLLAFFKH